MNLFSPHPDIRIRNLQVETINKYSKTVFLTNYINAAFVVLVMWTSSLPKEYLVIWLVAMYALTTVRLILSIKFWRKLSMLVFILLAIYAVEQASINCSRIFFAEHLQIH